MKLRNKKTGEIIESACIGVFKHKSSGDCERVDTEARSLEKVLEVWEDYTPLEPLIEDKKLRNIIKEWCEYYHISKLQYRPLSEIKGHYLADEAERYAIDVDIDNLKLYEFYNVDELCGEEE